MIKQLTFLIGYIALVGVSIAQPGGKVYTEKFLQSLRVPIGGIGTGDVLIGGRGNIEHVEVFNRPDRRRRLEKTFFALWLKKGTEAPVSKILEREIFPPYYESTHKYVAGLPRFRHAEFINNFPIAQWRLADEDIPLAISMEAFNPFIPLDVIHSSYPLIAFYWDFENNTTEPIEGSIVLNMENPIIAEEISNVYYQGEDLRGVRFIAREGADTNYQGSMFIGTTAADVDIQTHWFPGEWRDETHIFWDDFSEDGKIESKLSDWNTTYEPTAYNETTRRMASVLVHFSLEPGQQVRIPIYMAWYFPRREFRASEVFGIQEAAGKPFENAYAQPFADELDVLNEFRRRETDLHGLTVRFAEIIQASSYPESVIEALTTQAATLRTNLLQVTGEGNVHGFEGVLRNGWCCPGTCTHVWNYEQTLASLFPSLERKMREIEFLHNSFENGFQTHRSVLPIGDYWFDGPAAADGQMGTIVRAYREWKLSGDDEWLARLWPKIKKALEFAWYGPGEITEERFRFQESQMAWDPEKLGILSGVQHNTYDINFFGPSSMTTSIYLAALKASAEMAEAMGETGKSKEYLEVYRRGARITEDSLWNGSYFIQIIGDTQERSADKLEKVPAWQEVPATVKYQYGDGCLSDQLLGQYLAFISGLEYIMDTSKVKAAIKSVYDHNFIRPLRQFGNVQRVYGLNDEAGVVLCTWPHDNRPALPFVYSDEIWTGVEFQVAASLIYAGFVKEGLEIVKAVQNRYDGFKRNPFEHDESGVHYARAMASWSLLLAMSGIDYDATAHSLSFDPKMAGSHFSTFWSTGKAWGQFEIENGKAVLSVTFGELELKRFELKGEKVEPFEQPFSLVAGERLVLNLN
jgi:non-lysosomal glucosylceramidase